MLDKPKCGAEECTHLITAGIQHLAAAGVSGSSYRRLQGLTQRRTRENPRLDCRDQQMIAWITSSELGTVMFINPQIKKSQEVWRLHIRGVAYSGSALIRLSIQISTSGK
jgi:hypothetical protein